MKLRNKKTGEVDDFIFESITDRIDLYRRVGNSDTKNIYHYNSLAELEHEWEDYEKRYYHYITDGGCIQKKELYINECLADEFRKEIGNYFETKEEAEKAVEKLKAWKRLKDNGFKVDLWDYDGGNYQERIRTGRILFRVKDYEENDKELDLLFGGEE